MPPSVAGLFFNGRPLLPDPLPDYSLIPLGCSRCRSLATPAGGRQDAVDVRPVDGHAEVTANHRDNTVESPEISGEAEAGRSFLQEREEAFSLLICKPSRSTRRLTVLQGAPALVLVGLPPDVYCLARDAELPGNIRLSSPGIEENYAPEASFLQGTEIPAIGMIDHAES